jgi:hypothetical protein
MAPAEAIESLGKLRPGYRDGKRLSHKPLLALLALRRWCSHLATQAFSLKPDADTVD